MSPMDTTVDHEEIAQWTATHGGKPQKIEAPGVPDTPGIRIDFPGPGDEEMLSDLKKGSDISWKEFFEIFESQGLTFMYDKAAQGDPSLSYRFGKRNGGKEENSP